ncbi:unnamed protein product [Paramecium pentaurelia]|uniref:Ubiquitin-like domain-containing protein n=1 Tax=Paramecium pentaurelia TaxID=43138 RepID=A0A8S1UG13_9CILI|nr:unnamed protein product [Paramecium pentaurelia]
MKQGQVKRKFESFGFCSSNPYDPRAQQELVLHISNLIQKGNDFTIKMYSWMKISILKQKIHKTTKLDLADFRILYKNQELSLNNQDLEDYGIKNHVSLKLMARKQGQQLYFINSIHNILEESKKTQEIFQNAKWAVEGAFMKGITPKLTDFGTQGTYILEDLNHKPVAIFKPYDEEAFAPNNPRGMRAKMNSPGLRQGILSGEGVDREVAAYLIDQSSGHYHNVPITNYVQICHPAFHEAEEYKQFQYEKIPIKEGSFQLYIKHDDNVGNYGSGLYPSKEARKIAILDIRILNCDRNEENILVRKKKMNQPIGQTRQAYDYFLIPIDHGYAYPDCFKICRDEVVWYHWGQMTQPFTQEEKCFIEKIDPIKDIQILREKVKLREICLRNARISTTLLKLGAQSDLTIHDISEILYREDPDELSPIEIAISKAEHNYDNNIRVPKGYSNFKEKIFSNNLIQKSLEFDQSTLENQPRPKLGQPLINLEIIKDEDENKNLNNDKKIKNTQQIQLSDKKLARVGSQQEIKKCPKPIEKVWNEDFYSHVNFFLQQIIDSKIQEKFQSPRKYRARYISEEVK